MIVKIQIPIGGNGPQLALVYNKSRTFETYLDIDENLSAFMKGRAKAFFHVQLQGENLSIESEAAWQEW